MNETARSVQKFFSFRHDGTVPFEPEHIHCQGFMITLRHTTLGSTPLDKLSDRCRYLYLTTPNTQKIQSGGFRNRSPSKRVFADPRLRPRGNWDRQGSEIDRRNTV